MPGLICHRDLAFFLKTNLKCCYCQCCTLSEAAERQSYNYTNNLILDDTWFQQDRVTSHTCFIPNVLVALFLRRVRSNPNRLSSVLLFGGKVYIDKPVATPELKEKIRSGIDDVSHIYVKAYHRKSCFIRKTNSKV